MWRDQHQWHVAQRSSRRSARITSMPLISGIITSRAPGRGHAVARAIASAPAAVAAVRTSYPRALSAVPAPAGWRCCPRPRTPGGASLMWLALWVCAAARPARATVRILNPRRGVGIWNGCGCGRAGRCRCRSAMPDDAGYLSLVVLSDGVGGKSQPCAVTASRNRWKFGVTKVHGCDNAATPCRSLVPACGPFSATSHRGVSQPVAESTLLSRYAPSMVLSRARAAARTLAIAVLALLPAACARRQPESPWSEARLARMHSQQVAPLVSPAGAAATRPRPRPARVRHAALGARGDRWWELIGGEAPTIRAHRLAAPCLPPPAGRRRRGAGLGWRFPGDGAAGVGGWLCGRTPPCACGGRAASERDAVERPALRPRPPAPADRDLLPATLAGP